MIQYNIKLTFRNLVKNKIYATLIIGGFSIGFAACILIGLFYFTEKNVNTGFANHKQIYRLYDVKNNSCDINYDLNPILASGYSEIANTCPMEYYKGLEFIVKDEQANASTVLDNIISTNNNFFKIFSVEVMESLSSFPFDGKESVVITESVAKRLYKNGNAVGQTLNIGNRYVSINGRITAVIKDLPENSSFKAEVILNSDNENFRMSKTCNNGKCFNLTNQYIQLAEGVNIDNFTSLLNRTLNLGQFEIARLGLQKLDDIYLSSPAIKDMHNKGNARLLKIFIATAILILLMSSINYLNYTTSMQYAKLKTIGINRTNGAGWSQLISFSFTEVSIGVLISIVLSLIITFLLLPYSGILFGKALHLNTLTFVQLFPALGVTLIAVILLNSLAPFYLLSRFNVSDFLSGTKKRRGTQAGKQIMLTFQLATSIALVAAVIGVFKQLNYAKQSDLGFDKEMLVRIDMSHNFKNPQAFRQEINKLPFVSKSTFSNGAPGKISLRMGSNDRDNEFFLSCITIGDDYLETMGIRLLQGREFLTGDIDKVCLLNETALKRYGFKSFEGERFNNGKEGGYEIIGVVNNFHTGPFYDAIEPLVLIYAPQAATEMLSIKLRPGDIARYMDQIKRTWKKFLPYDVFSYTFYDEQFQSMYSKDEKMAKTITFFSVIAVIITCMGILSQIFLISLYRTKEIGIRKVNGATIPEILAMLNKDFIISVIIAFIIATPIAYYSMHEWLKNFAYKTDISWWIFALAGSLATAVALLTASWQSWKAATRNPVEALRYE
jgi:putative ABC transport system permease protein